MKLKKTTLKYTKSKCIYSYPFFALTEFFFILGGFFVDEFGVVFFFAAFSVLVWILLGSFDIVTDQILPFQALHLIHSLNQIQNYTLKQYLQK